MEKIKTPILFIVTVFTVAFLWAFVSTNSYRSKAAMGEALVYFGTQAVNGNDITLPVTIMTDATQKVSAATVDINYDKEKVQFVSVDHTGCGNLSIDLTPQNSPSIGVVSETKVSNDSTGASLPSGAFCLTNYKFTAIGSGNAVFSINTTTSQIVGPGPIAYTIKTNADSTKTIAVNNNNPIANVYFDTGVISSDKKSVLLPVFIETDSDKKVSSAKIGLWYLPSWLSYDSVDSTNCDKLNTAFDPINSTSSGEIKGVVRQTKIRLDSVLPSGKFCFTKFKLNVVAGVTGKTTVHITQTEVVGPGPTSYNVIIGPELTITIENGLITGVDESILTCNNTTNPPKACPPGYVCKEMQTFLPGSGGICVPQGQGNVTLNLKLKFQGVVKKPASGQETQTVKVKIVDASGNTTSGSGQFTADNSGFWTGMVSMDVIPGSGYKIFVKGSKHVQKRVCDVVPTETYPGSYHCDQGGITIAAGQNTFDFSGIYMLVGDLPDQDGVVNSYDTSLVRNNLGKSDVTILSKADLNFDGIVDTQDYSLIISALSIRGDEGE